MAAIATDNFFLSCFLFGISFCGISILIHRRQDPSSKSLPRRFDPLETLGMTDEPSYPLACLLEDAPETALAGQAYELAIPLMTPFACILRASWQNFYKTFLGKPGINYWEWQDKPESREVCPELSILFDLPAPQGYAKEILEALAAEKYLCKQSLDSLKIKQQGNLSSAFDDLKDGGKFADRDLQVQATMRLAFKHWHEAAIKQIGEKSLQAVYRVCYGTSHAKIQDILGECQPSIPPMLLDESAPWWKVLNVNPAANRLQVEKAYKQSIRLWHPDLNRHPQATQITSRLNLAYEYYQSLDRSPPGIDKIRDWLKTLFTH